MSSHLLGSHCLRDGLLKQEAMVACDPGAGDGTADEQAEDAGNVQRLGASQQ
ncbi:hypothetical protein [Pseudomonas sp. SJZ079]|uniref:hypothetical protein n=1 Tax=Pseudomonas sp. SJZ079 TaxID=2572887 RepID=UPI002113ACB2